jgi:phosphohistidine swiveling domain-containing protein
MKWLKRFDSRHTLLNVFAVIKSFNGDSVGTENKNILVVSKGNKITFYRLKKENEKLKEVWKQKFLDSRYMSGRFRWINETLEIAENLSKKLLILRFKDLSNKELSELYKEYVKIFIRIFEGYDMSQPEVPAVCEEELQKLILDKVKDDKLALEMYSILTTPAKINPLKQEEINWLKILLNIKEKGFVKEILNQIKEHSTRFGWISTQENLSFLDSDYFINIAKQNKENVEEIRRKLKETEERSGIIENKRKKILNELKDSKIEEYSEILREAGYLRILTRLAWTKLEYSSRDLFKEISKRANTDNVRYMFPEEVEKALIEQKKIDNVDLRIKNYVMRLNQGKIEFYTGKEADKIEKNEIVEEAIKTNEVKGSCASQGFVRGKVKIIHSHVDDQLKEVDKMEKGDILIAGSTKPQLIVACRKASAIVTDEGGICSHAAIVSREFGIPCIVGTVHATKAFKDGDIVEVDADNGVAKIIKRK